VSSSFGGKNSSWARQRQMKCEDDIGFRRIQCLSFGNIITVFADETEGNYENFNVGHR
jgi:hypothetical protein